MAWGTAGVSVISGSRLQAPGYGLSQLSPAQIIQYALQVGGKRSEELHAAPVGGVVEDQPRGVQERPLQPLHGADVTGHAAVHAAVHRVADDRVPDRAQVHANLVRAAGVDRHLAQGQAWQRHGAGDARDRVPGMLGAGRHLHPVGGITADCRVDAPPRLHHAPHQRDVLLLDLAIVELARQLLMGGIVLGHDHHAGRAAVQPVHDAGPQLAADAAEIFHVVQQRVDQRAGGMARAGVDHHAGGLVDHGHVRVLVQHVDGQGLGGGLGRDRLWKLDLDAFALAQDAVGLGDAGPQRHQPVGDELLDLRSRVRFQHRHEEAVEPLPLVLRAGDELEQAQAARRRERASCGAVGFSRASHASMTRLSGASTTEMNCDVDRTPKTVPRGSPR